MRKVTAQLTDGLRLEQPREAALRVLGVVGQETDQLIPVTLFHSRDDAIVLAEVARELRRLECGVDRLSCIHIDVETPNMPMG